MIVIAHQHIGVNAPAGLATSLAERFEKPNAVPIILINHPALVAPSHHMIGGSGIFDVPRPSHNTNFLGPFHGKCSRAGSRRFIT
jgi:hypothetical protein